jgi:hypothetical protein
MQDKAKYTLKLETPQRVSAFHYLHSLTTLISFGVSFISLPTLILSSETQRGGIPKQLPRKCPYLTSTTSVGMALMPDRVT